jgi:hypothetical protein
MVVIPYIQLPSYLFSLNKGLKAQLLNLHYIYCGCSKNHNKDNCEDGEVGRQSVAALVLLLPLQSMSLVEEEEYRIHITN